MFPHALAFLVGHCAVHGLPTLPASSWVVGALLSTFVLYLLRRSFLFSIFFALAFGITWAWLHASIRLEDQLQWPEAVPVTGTSAPSSEPTHRDAEVTGYIASLVDVSGANEPGSQAQSARFTFQIVEADAGIPSRIELSWYDIESYPRPGELWRLQVRLRSPRGFANPGGSDYEAQLFRLAIGATGYVRASEGSDGAERLSEAGWRFPVLQARAALDERLANTLTRTPMLGIIQGLAVGDTQKISGAQWRVFSNTGTTHLMAISGLHIAMVAALAMWVIGWPCRLAPLQTMGWTIQGVQALAGMFAATGYSVLAGFSVPTQRTLVMLAVVYATRLLRRNLPATHGFGLALFGVLLIDPFAPLAPGFWLSFGAVATIFLAMGGRLSTGHWFREYLQIQMAVSIGLLPFLIGAFGSLSIISPAVNLVAIPFFTFVVVPLVLLGTLLSAISLPLGWLPLQAAAWLLEQCWIVLEWASRVPLATWHLPQLPLWAALCLILGCMIAISPGVTVTRAAGWMLCLPAFIWQPERPAAGKFELAVLDVGQGLACVIVTQSHVLVYDAGPSFRSGRDTGEMVVLPYLHSRGIRHVDALVISHNDNDHAGGMQSILAGMPVRRTLLGPSLSLDGIAAAERCAVGQSWEWDGVRFRVLHPPSGDDAGRPSKARMSDNDSSCVVQVSGQFASALLLGDVERAAETQLLSAVQAGRTDIVVVPHHGSRTSSTENFVRATHPQFALISAGFGNRWGFPKDDVVARWRSVGAETVATSQDGALEILPGKDDEAGVLHLRRFRLERRAYWHKSRENRD